MTSATETQQQRPRSRWTLAVALILVCWLVCTLGVFGVGDLLKQVRGPTPDELARQQARAQWIASASGTVRSGFQVFFWLLLTVLSGLTIWGAICLGAWLWKKAITVYPNRQGLYPLITPSVLQFDPPVWLQWLVGRVSAKSLLVDPNRNATSVLELDSQGVRFLSPDAVSASQVQATTGAQLVQATAAEASGERTPGVGRTRQARRHLDARPEVIIYQREQPPIAHLPIPDSHIDRLLVEQGQLIPQEVDGQGQTSI